MSHFTRLRTSLVDGDLIEEALTEMKRTFTRGVVRVAGYAGNSTGAEFRILTTNPSYDIGLVKKEGGYEIVADWWGIRDTRAEDFSSDLARTYTVLATKRTLTSQGFSVVNEAVDAGGVTRLVLRRMV